MEYFCNICKKQYASYQSLWNHNNTFHKNIKTNETTKKPLLFACKTCKQEFTNRQTKWRHEKKCIKPKETNNIKNQMEQIEKQTNDIENQMEQIKNQMVKLTDIQLITLQTIEQIIQPKTLNNLLNDCKEKEIEV